MAVLNNVIFIICMEKIENLIESPFQDTLINILACLNLLYVFSNGSTKALMY